jgi:hypothetical protein
MGHFSFQALCLLLGVAASYAYPPSYGHFLKNQDGQGRLGGEHRGGGGGGEHGGGGGGGFAKKGHEAHSVQHAIEEVIFKLILKKNAKF